MGVDSTGRVRVPSRFRRSKLAREAYLTGWRESREDLLSEPSGTVASTVLERLCAELGTTASEIRKAMGIGEVEWQRILARADIPRLARIADVSTAAFEGIRLVMGKKL